MPITPDRKPLSRRRLLHIGGLLLIAVLVTLGVFASNDWFPRTDPFSGKRYGWFGKPLAKNAPNAWNPLAMPSPTPTPQLSKELIYAGSRLLSVEDKNATAVPPADLAIWRPSTGIWWVRISGSEWITHGWGESTDSPVPGDYDGDGTTDFSVVRPNTGTCECQLKWYVVFSSNGGFYDYTFGESTDLPAPADYDGDGKTDEAVFRQSNGTWYIHASTAGYYTDSFGGSTDLPAAADYDGDGKADLGYFHPFDRKFHSKPSSGGSAVEISPNFSPSGAAWEPVSSDYDGDGKADYAVYNKNSGVWYVRSSSSGTYASDFTWGTSGDKVVQNDYDSDGKCDYAVWRPSNGTWYILQSADSYSQRTVTWGQEYDIPVPAFYRR